MKLREHFALSDFTRLLSPFFSLSLFIRGFPVLSALDQGCAVVRVDNRAMSRLCEGLPDCKGNRANVSRRRRGACTRFAKLLINAHGKIFLFLSNPSALSPSFSLSFRDYMTAHVKADWVGLFGRPQCVAIHARDLDHSVTKSFCDLRFSPPNENCAARNFIAQREFAEVLYRWRRETQGKSDMTEKRWTSFRVVWEINRYVGRRISCPNFSSSSLFALLEQILRQVS